MCPILSMIKVCLTNLTDRMSYLKYDTGMSQKLTDRVSYLKYDRGMSH
jgi:hypothetical protein